MKYIKITFKIIVATIMLLSSIVCNFAGISAKVYAAEFYIDEASLYSKGTYSDLLLYNDMNIETTFVVYKKDGKEYPAYCISPGIDGVGEQGEYNVKVSSLLNDVNIWRVITNGYPYKSASELGCKSAEEAFVATKHAVYCVLLNREVSWYGAIGEAGARVKSAMETIIRNAKSGSSGKPSSNITINEIDPDWKEDQNWSGYLSRTFDINAETSYDTFTVSIDGTYPEETRIADVSNNLRKTFTAGEKFKIAIPIKSVSNSGSFTIKVSTKLATKPVLYGKAPNSSLQDYALTASIYENAEGNKTIYYTKNATKLTVIKQDDKTHKRLSGVEFKILDSNKKPVYTNLITNSNGEITLNNMLPGTYYLEEVKTKEGYVKYDKQIKFDIEYNQTLTINVNNTLEKRTENITNTQNINVSNSKEVITVKDNKEYVNQTEKQKEINEVNSRESKEELTSVKKETHSDNIKNTSKEVNLSDTVNNIRLSNKDININNSAQSLTSAINNENININNNKQNISTKINNINKNVNLNSQNAKTENKNENNNIDINKQIEQTYIYNTQNDKDVSIKNMVSGVNDAKIIENIQSVATEGGSANVNINTNSNISSYNGIVKLPKTGM